MGARGQIQHAANGNVNNELLPGGLVIEPLRGHARRSKKEQPNVANETNRKAEQNGRIPLGERGMPPNGNGENENGDRQTEEGTVNKADVRVHKNIGGRESDAHKGDT